MGMTVAQLAPCTNKFGAEPRLAAKFSVEADSRLQDVLACMELGQVAVSTGGEFAGGGFAQCGPIEIRSKLFATNGAVGGLLDGRASLVRNGASLRAPLRDQFLGNLELSRQCGGGASS